MTTILAYGDSLTWGSCPLTGGRHPKTDRWPDVLAAGLGNGVEVIAEGLRGRTTAYDEHLADCDRNSARLLPTVLYTHAPVALVVTMLGTNDMKPHICGTAIGAKQGMRRLVQIAQNHTQGMTDGHRADVLIVAPPPQRATDDEDMSHMFDGGLTQSQRLAESYRALAEEMGVAYFDAGQVCRTHPADGVHMDGANTKALGVALVPVVSALLA